MIKLTLKRSEKRALKLGVFAVVVLILLNLVVFPFYDHIDFLANRRVVLTKDLRDLVKRLKDSKRIVVDIKRLNNKIDEYADRVLSADSEELVQIELEELVSNLAKEQGLSISNSYKEKTRQLGFGYIQVATRITVQGEYSAIIYFLQAIQNREELVAATDLSLKHYRGYTATVTVVGLAKARGK